VKHGRGHDKLFNIYLIYNGQIHTSIIIISILWMANIFFWCDVDQKRTYLRARKQSLRSILICTGN